MVSIGALSRPKPTLAPALPRGVATREALSTMQRLRTNWLALMGAIFLLTLTVSSAFGAPPSGTAGNRGQSISGFVHELVFGADEADDETNEDQDEVDEEANADDEDLEEDTEEEDSADEGLEEDTEADAEEREVPEEFANHGECVSEAAHDTEGFEESDAANKGEWVSLHARYICWGLTPPEDGEEDTTGDETEADVDEDTDEDADELAAREQARADRAAARAERRAAREAAKAAQQERAVETTGRSNGNGGGNGHGRGGGKP